MSGSDNGGSPGAGKPEESRPTEHLNIKVTDNNNEVFFKIKRTTQLKKLMDAFCERQGKAPSSVRFLFEGTRVGPTDSPETVRILTRPATQIGILRSSTPTLLESLNADIAFYSSRWPMATRWRSTRSRSEAA
jgi:hypothetical protein